MGLHLLRDADDRQQADFASGLEQPGFADGRHGAFDIILQGIIQV